MKRAFKKKIGKQPQDELQVYKISNQEPNLT